MTKLTRGKIVQLVLDDIKNKLPENAILNSLKWVYTPSEFDKEFMHYKRGVDLYLTQICEATPQELELLSFKNTDKETQHILQLISAKALLTLQEFSMQASEEFTIHLDTSQVKCWLGTFYTSRGEILQTLEVWSA